jgi:hypothetical protein
MTYADWSKNIYNVYNKKDIKYFGSLFFGWGLSGMESHSYAYKNKIKN